MKTLTLLRHGKSSWDDHHLSDHDRPLAKRGLRDAPRMGKRMSKRGLEPDWLLTSSAVRALQTAELVEPALRHPGLELRVDPRIYLATPGELLAVLTDTPDRIGELVMVGHNPGLTQLANMLLPELRLANLPTAGVVAIDCDIDSWADIESGTFDLRFYDYPKNRG